MPAKDLFNKKNIFNIAAIILSLIIAYNIYKLQLREMKKIEQKNQETMEKNTVREYISQFERKVTDYKNLLSKRDSGVVIDTFSKIAQQTGVKIITVRPLPEQKYPEYIKMPFDLVLSTPDSHALGKFISKVESYEDVYMVDSLEIRSQTQARDLSVNLTISHFEARN
jgi:Tfp pilus assembly protein PilO